MLKKSHLMKKEPEKPAGKPMIYKKLQQLIPAMFFICPNVLSYGICFGQDTLNFKDCINISLEKNYNIQIIRNEELVSENNVTPGNAGFLPTIGAEGRISQSVVNSEQVFFSRPLRLNLIK